MVYNYFYKITNIVNNKFYYGVHKTNNLNDKYLGSGKAIISARNKYGKENFKREIVKLFDTYEECLAHEALIVDEDMVKDPMCYNMKTGGKGGSSKGANLGKKRSEETRRKMSASQQNISEETRKKLSESNKGHIVSEETRKKIRAAHLAIPLSEEHRAKISTARKGKKRSEETRARMSASRKGMIYKK